MSSEEADSVQSTENKTSKLARRGSNPIIFARTETIHIPKPLQNIPQHEKLRDAVYSCQDDGSLKQSPLPSIEEDEEYEEVKPVKEFGFWKKFLYYLCCLCEDIPGHGGSMSTPLIDATSPRDNSNAIGYETPTGPFLDKQSEQNQGKKTLVLDLDETLVHSTFQTVDDCDYVIPVTIEGNIYSVYVYLRPGALEFIERLSELYEIIVYTASLRIYADPLLNMMDPENKISARLFRDHCVCSGGVFVKDLGLLGRELDSVVMVDNSSLSYKFQPKNGIECTAFIDDKTDTELIDMIPFFEYLATKSDVRLYANMWNESREDRRNNNIKKK